MNEKTPLSLIILTYNEEENIEYCLQSVSSWIDEIIIIDSNSTDKTIEICKKYTNKIFTHKFENQAKQFNWALDNVPIKNNWVMRLDADESVTNELSVEIQNFFKEYEINKQSNITGIYLNRRVYFMGKWIKHGDYYPIWLLRIFQKDKGQYEEITEEHIMLSSGKAIKLKNDFIDNNRKGLSFWTEKHSNWAIGEMYDTLALMENKKLAERTIDAKLFTSQMNTRRWLKKNIYARFPVFLRAFLFFIYRYFVRLGFLDGIEGLIFHTLEGFWYRFYIDAKIYEAKKLGKWETGRVGSYGAGVYEAAGVKKD